MRVIGFSALLLILGCGGTGEVTSGADGGTPDGGLTTIPNLETIAITPNDTVITIDGDQAATQRYTAEGTFKDGHKEDITSRVRFTIDNVALGSFSGSTFTSFTANGGYGTVIASAGVVQGQATLVVKIRQRYNDPAASGLPADPSPLFDGPGNEARKPTLVYPADGVLVPPNLQKLELQWRKGSDGNTVFELSFQSRSTDVKIYTRCVTPLGDGCAYLPESKVWRWLAESNRGNRLTFTARGTDDSGSAVGTATAIDIHFSFVDLEGALYYWTTPAGQENDDPEKAAIYRWDFGSTSQTAPELVVEPSMTGGHCVGCHSLSPDGRRLFVTSEGSYEAYVLLFDTRAKQPIVPFDTTDRVAWASWEWPDGARFLGTFADESETRFRSHDINVYDFMGNFLETIAVGGSDATPSAHPDWAPDGQTIAYTRIGVAEDPEGGTTRRGQRASIRIVHKTATGWSAPIALTDPEQGKGRFYPTFSVDSRLILYNESICADGNDGGNCNMDDDPEASLWIMEPEVGAERVRLANADKPGIMDARARVQNTFPKWTPFTFKRTGELGSRLFWFTFSSDRAYGLRSPDPGETLIWMAGVDPDACLRGEDGSFAAFAIPFQDIKRDNHTAQWAKRVIILE
jgi:hypothetical protein